MKTKSLMAGLLLVFADLFSASLLSHPAEVDQAPTSSIQSKIFTPDGAWCWFSDPRAVYHDRKIYAGWMTSGGSVQVGTRDLGTGELMLSTLAEHFQVDDHDHPSLLFLPDNRLMAFYSLHAEGDLHLRITRKPADISEWTQDRTLGFNRFGHGPRGTTYANPVLLSEEADTVYVFWRGSDFKPSFSISKNLGATWSEPRTLIRPTGSGNNDRPYVKYWSDGKKRINFLFTDGHPDINPANSVYFLRYENGLFRRADGSRVGAMIDLPFDPSQCDRIYDGASAGRAWVWDISENGEGNPVAVYTRLPAKDDHRYRYVFWDGARWRDSAITSAGKWFPHTPAGKIETEPYYSGGITIGSRDPGVVYLSRPVRDVFEIERWTTADGGRTWTSIAITGNSESDNVRPVAVRNAPRGTPDLLWMRNKGGYVHYTNYRTEIRMIQP